MPKHMGSIVMVMLLIMSAGEDGGHGAAFTMATKWKLQHSTAPFVGVEHNGDGAKFSSNLFGAFRKALDDDCLDEDCEPKYDIKCEPIGCGPCKYVPGSIKGKCTALEAANDEDHEYEA